MNRSSRLIILGNFVIISYAGNLVYLLVFVAPISMCHLDTIKKEIFYPDSDCLSLYVTLPGFFLLLRRDRNYLRSHKIMSRSKGIFTVFIRIMGLIK